MSAIEIHSIHSHILGFLVIDVQYRPDFVRFSRAGPIRWLNSIRVGGAAGRPERLGVRHVVRAGPVLRFPPWQAGTGRPDSGWDGPPARFQTWGSWHPALTIRLTKTYDRATAKNSENSGNARVLCGNGSGS